MDNKTIKLVILGASAYPEICEIIYDINKVKKTYDVICLLDDDNKLHNTLIEGVEVKGELSLANTFSKNVKFIFGIGSIDSRLIRYEILMRLQIPINRFETLVHPSAKVYSNTKISNGVIIYPGALVSCHTVISPFVIIMPNAVIGAKNFIGEGVLITALVSSAANVKFGSYCYIGQGCVINEKVIIGPGSLVNMGTKVYRNTSSGSNIFGSPQKELKGWENVSSGIIEMWNNNLKTMEKNKHGKIH